MSAALPTPEILDSQHPELIALGWKLLQPHRFADNDAEHIQCLLEHANFPQGAHVLDIGCGVGECARMMKEQRPDLTFTLLNFSAEQLKDCPDDMVKLLASAHSLPFDDEHFDAVMFNAALGNMDAMVALAEASRVLKPGGVLFLNEVARVEGDNAEMERLLQFRAYNITELMAFAHSMGLHDGCMQLPRIARHFLSEMLGDNYEAAFAGTTPFLLRLVKAPTTPLAAKFGFLFDKHERIALQFSGGKDSLAVLFALRPWWDRLCVYWTNPGDPFPETQELMAEICAAVPNFVEIAGRQKEIIEADGWPSDVVPVLHTTDGQFVFGEQPFKVQGRLDCCWRSLMLPMHERMVADGVTCIIRGKRSEEKDKTVTRTGSVLLGIETIYPVWDWSAQDVLDYLADEGVPLPESYEQASHSLDCMSCTAWQGEGLGAYLEAKHPEQFTEYRRRLILIKQAVNEQLSQFEV